MVALVGVCVLPYSFVVYVPFYERLASGVESDRRGRGKDVKEGGEGDWERGEERGKEGEKAVKDYLVIN